MRLLVGVECMRAVRKPRGAHLEVVEGTGPLSVIMVLSIDGVAGLVELSPADADELARELRRVAAATRGVDANQG